MAREGRWEGRKGRGEEREGVVWRGGKGCVMAVGGMDAPALSWQK